MVAVLGDVEGGLVDVEGGGGECRGEVVVVRGGGYDGALHLETKGFG